jgi:Fe-S oxidoreductase
MDLARIKAISVLGVNFWLHLGRSVLPHHKVDQAELFRGYFREDRLTSFTAAEHEELPGLETCVACGLCPGTCRVMTLSEGRFRGPMHLAAAASRSQPDFIHDLDSLPLCAVCGQCEPICPERVPVAAMARAMRRMLWRVAPETLPAAYHQAAEHLRTFGNIYGPEPKLDLPIKPGAPALLLLGPVLRLMPERAAKVAGTLAKLGYDLTIGPEGPAGGVAEDLGLGPDRAWIPHAVAGRQLVIVADPELWLAVRDDPRLKGVTVKSALEAVAEKWPAGASLAGTMPGPAAVHDADPLARRSGLARLTREFLGRAGVELREMADGAENSPPVGWEGGIELVEPELAARLAAARREDAVNAGAKTLISASAQDVVALGKGGDERINVRYLFDLLGEALRR